MRFAIVVMMLCAIAAASPAWADATVPQPAPATSRADACKARMEEARQALAATFADVHLIFDHGYNPGSAARDDWEVTVTAMSNGHKLSGMVGIANSGQWSFFPRNRWFDNSGMWKETFRMERYPTTADHEIAAIIEGDHIPLHRARAFAAIVRPAIDDCLAMPR